MKTSHLLNALHRLYCNSDERPETTILVRGLAGVIAEESRLLFALSNLLESGEIS